MMISVVICPTRIDIINSSVPCNHVVMSSLQASARLSMNTEEPDVRIWWPIYDQTDEHMWHTYQDYER